MTGFSSCDNEEAIPETEYFFTFKSPNDLDIQEFKILVQFVRVYEINENEEGIRTIYIGGENLTYRRRWFQSSNIGIQSR